MLDYKSLTSLDMPEVDTVLVEDPDPNCPFGAKEAGQGPLLPVMPAVANAIFDAVGVRIDELPITPDKVSALGRGRQPARGPRAVPGGSLSEPIVVLPPWEGGDGNALQVSEARLKWAPHDAAPDSVSRQKRAGQRASPGGAGRC
jgi:hypothetical protein